jgi:D-glycero-D-manno-heptose 1,7-bisphosphate phosphatase
MKNLWLNPRFAQSTAPCSIVADRDGTLIEHVDYVHDPDQIRLLPGVKGSVHGLIQAKIPFFIFTNQSGVGRGYCSIEAVQACQKRLFELLEIQPDSIAGWCIAPEAPGSLGGYRKPSPRFINEAAKHLGQTTDQFHMIGDTLVDLETAWNSGAQAWAVASGKPQLPAAHFKQEIRGAYHFKNDFSNCISEIQNGIKF